MSLRHIRRQLERQQRLADYQKAQAARDAASRQLPSQPAPMPSRRSGKSLQLAIFASSLINPDGRSR